MFKTTRNSLITYVIKQKTRKGKEVLQRMESKKGGALHLFDEKKGIWDIFCGEGNLEACKRRKTIFLNVRVVSFDIFHVKTVLE